MKKVMRNEAERGERLGGGNRGELCERRLNKGKKQTDLLTGTDLLGMTWLSGYLNHNPYL
jgi:hypothetical protein